MTILAGDIGGESKLALFSHEFDGKKIIIKDLVIQSEILITKNYEIDGKNGQKTLNTQALIDDFLQKEYYGQEDKYGEGINQKILGACFGIAGPVERNPVEDNKDNQKATISRDNLNISFDELDFDSTLPCPGLPVSFINDMVAIGKNIFLPEYEPHWQIVYQGTREPKPKDDRAIMLVSGGLGQAHWYWDHTKKELSHKSSEGGHALFAPRNELEGELWLYLLKERQQVISYEYVLSAPGLIRIYEFIKSTNRYGEESAELREPLTNNNADPTPIIDWAIDHSDPLADAALNMFISIMGARAGDLALTYEAKGGIYLGGLPIPIDKLRDNVFKEAFLDKEGNFRQYNEAIPVYAYQYEGSVLWGAARHAVDAGFVTKGKFAYKRMNRQK